MRLKTLNFCEKNLINSGCDIIYEVLTMPALCVIIIKLNYNGCIFRQSRKSAASENENLIKSGDLKYNRSRGTTRIRILP